MKLGEKIKLVRKHRGLTQRELGERLHLDGNAANRIAQYESGFRTPKESRTKDIAKALNVREENFFTRAETPEDIIRLMIWYDWEHGCGGSVPIDTILLFDNFEEVEKLLKEWLKEPTQYELFIETVYCVGFLYIRKALLQCALRIFLSYPDMRHEKVKLRKCRNKTLKNHDMNGYVSFEKWASSNWQGVRFFKSL